MEQFIKVNVTKDIDAVSGCSYRYVCGKNDIFFPHTHEHYEVFVTVSGTVHHWINGDVQKLPEGSLVFIRPNDAHGYLYNDEESLKTEYVNLTFSKEIADSLFFYLSEDDFPVKEMLSAPKPPTVILSTVAKKQLLYQMSQLNTLHWENKQALKLRVKTLLVDVFAQHFYHIPISDSPIMPHWFEQLLKEMERVENFTIGTSQMVALSKKSYEHLSRVAKKHLDLTLTEYVNKLRINHAANLLLNSNYSIIDICYLCGFQNLGYFYRVFKKEYSLSPLQFITQHKNV